MSAKSEVKRRRILDAGVEMFARSGIRGTRLKDIAEKAQLAKATLYYYFPDGKETIFSAAIRHVVGSVWARVVDEVEAQPTPAEQLETYVHTRVRIFDDEVTRRGVSVATWEELKPLADRVLKSFFDEERALLRGIMARGVEDGSFKELDPDVSALVVQSALRGFTADGPFGVPPEARERQVAQIFALLSSGIVEAP